MVAKEEISHVQFSIFATLSGADASICLCMYKSVKMALETNADLMFLF